MRKRETVSAAFQGILTPLLTAVAVLWLFTGIANLERGRDDRGRARLEETIRRSAVTCYADEGIYPPTLSYLEEHYGLQVDTGRYTVYYTAVGSNLMPDITVLKNGD
ncbi:MAG: hypothetical protein LKJ80_07260 [Oscillibacter sp.]|jgi:hypothetical protein|nr:hypothetical protein [Oscillibacter sp.]